MTLTLEIEKNVYGGDGLGRLGDGRVAFVPGTFGGETVRAEIVEQKRNFVRARCVEWITRSPDRVEPGPTVPGMVYAGVNYAAELRMKAEQLGNFLGKVGLAYPHVEVVAGRSSKYRNKATYHVQRTAGRWTMGYRRELSHDVVDVLDDPLAREEIGRALPQIRAGVFALLTQGARNVRRSAAEAATVTVRHTAVDGVKWWLGDPPSSLVLTEQTAGHSFEVPADGFYQVNPQVGDDLVKAVRASYLDGADRAPNLVDLYCGVGVFGLACAKAAAGEVRLVGVESARGSVAAAKRNAVRLGLKANFFCERVGGSLGRIKLGDRSMVIVDPPRGGLEKGVAEWLAASRAPRLVYVSCDPATLTRDLSAILKGYRLARVRLFDLFPRTARFETLVELEK